VWIRLAADPSCTRVRGRESSILIPILDADSSPAGDRPFDL
jgi:hypothetical protein